MSRKDRKAEVSREELLESGGSFSVGELHEIGLGPKEEDGGRPMLFRNNPVPFRLMPAKLLDATEKLLDETGDIALVLETLWAAFEIYRNCVNKGDITAPLTRAEDGVYEWPKPAIFTWDNLEAVRLTGFALGGNKTTGGPKVSVIVEEGGKIFKKTRDVHTGDLIEEEVSAMAAKPHELFQFEVDRLADVRFVNPQGWQKTSLRSFATSLSRFTDLACEGRLNVEHARTFLDSLFTGVRKDVHDWPTVRYAKEGEPRDTYRSFLFTFL